MFSRLDASNYIGSAPFYEKKFEEILSKITACYYLMKSDKVKLENDENKIRDCLLRNYLKNNTVRSNVGLTDWLFEREVQEDHSVGRTDIKIVSLDTFNRQEAYYILECKRLDSKYMNGTSGLNAKYIENGINRFTTNYYSSFYRVNGMIGFVVDQLDIHTNIKSINSLLSNSSKSIETTKSIAKDNFIQGFDFHYHSTHKDANMDELKVYHLMFDFHENIQD